MTDLRSAEISAQSRTLTELGYRSGYRWSIPDELRVKVGLVLRSSVQMWMLDIFAPMSWGYESTASMFWRKICFLCRWILYFRPVWRLIITDQYCGTLERTCGGKIAQRGSWRMQFFLLFSNKDLTFHSSRLNGIKIVATMTICSWKQLVNLMVCSPDCNASLRSVG